MPATAPCPPSLKRFELPGGGTMAYADSGSGTQILLFIHGLGTSHETWQKTVDSLQDSFRCIAIDLPGNGCSATGNYPYTMDFFARCVIHFIGGMRLQNVTLVGHSMGGQIAMTALLLAPLCAERLVLCAPAGFESFTVAETFLSRHALSFAGWMDTDTGHLRRLMQSSFYNYGADARQLTETLIGLIQRQPTGVYKRMVDRCIDAMLREPVLPRLGTIRQPVFIIFGAEDALIPNSLLHHHTSTKQIAASGARRLKRSTLKVIPRAGHFVQWECAALVNRYIAEWMANSQKD